MQPFGPQPVQAVLGGRLVYGAADEPLLLVLNERGDTSLTIRQGLDPRPVTSDLLRLYASEFIDVGSPFQQMTENMVRDAPFPEALPYYESAFADRDGRLWIREYRRLSEDRVRWFVIEESGEWLAELDLEPAVRLVDATGHSVLLIVTDQLGIQRIERRPILQEE